MLHRILCAFLVGVLSTILAACDLETMPPANQGGMDARINLLPGAIEIINENDFRWYGLRTTLHANEGTFSDRHLFGNDNWPWLRPDRVREPNEEFSPSLHPNSTSFRTSDGEPYSGNKLEGGTLYYTIQPVTLEAKTKVDGPYDLTFSIPFEDALATPWPERKPTVLLHPTPNPPGQGFTTIWLKHHEPKYDEVMAIAAPYDQGLGGYYLPLDKWREVEALLGTAPAPALPEQEQRSLDLWKEQWEHWEVVDTFQGIMDGIMTDRVIDLDESKHLCFTKDQWQRQFIDAINYILEFRTVDNELVESTPGLLNLEKEVRRILTLLDELECE